MVKTTAGDRSHGIKLEHGTRVKFSPLYGVQGHVLLCLQLSTYFDVTNRAPFDLRIYSLTIIFPSELMHRRGSAVLRHRLGRVQNPT
jgi:hypothetical protein